MYLIEFLSQCVAFIPSDIYLTKTTGKRLIQSGIGRMPKIVPWCVELEETVGEETVDEPFSQRVLSYIYI